MNAAGETAGGTVAKGSLWNLAGLGLPLVAALIAVPLIVEGLGIERFGVLALAWAIIGAASMLDLGIGRALTQTVASRRAAGEAAELPALVLTATAVLAALGIAGAAVLLATASSLVTEVFRVGPALAAEARNAVMLLAVSLPFVLCAAAMQGVLEGYLRFDISNLVRIPLSILNYVVPLLILPFTANLAWIVGGTVLARCLGFAVYAVLARRVMGQPQRPVGLRVALVRPVLRLAGWMTVSSMVATAIVYLDRLVIGAVDSMSAVAFYATPYELVIRLSLLSGAVGAALLPVFSSLARGSAEEMERAFARGLRYVVLLVFPATLFIALFAPEGLALWLSEEFARASSRITQLLAAGVFVNSLAIIPLIFLYGAGRADRVARLHLVELPLYALLLWQLVARFGAEGAAMAWTIRVIADAALLFGIVRGLYPTYDFRYWRVGVAMGGGLGALAIGIAIPTGIGRLAYGAACFAAFAVYAWFALLTRDERLALRKALSRT